MTHLPPYPNPTQPRPFEIHADRPVGVYARLKEWWALVVGLVVITGAVVGGIVRAEARFNALETNGVIRDGRIDKLAGQVGSMAESSAGVAEELHIFIAVMKATNPAAAEAIRTAVPRGKRKPASAFVVPDSGD